MLNPSTTSYSLISGKNDLLKEYSIIWIKKGWGSYEVDFKQYVYNGSRVIFMAPGQYFKLNHGEMELYKLNISESSSSKINDYRYLFKHLVAVGYISVPEVDFENFEGLFTQNAKSDNPNELLYEMLAYWLLQNPFKSSYTDLNLLFDIKELVDSNYKERPAVEELAEHLEKPINAVNHVLKSNLQTTLLPWMHSRLELEAKRELQFSSKSIKEIGYDLGFSNSSDFQHFFKRFNLFSPGSFREKIGYVEKQELGDDFLELLELHYREKHHLGFYAQKLFVSEKTLNRKLKQQFHLTGKKLIINRLIREAKTTLTKENVKQTAYYLGFDEAHHFSSFFKKNVGLPPTQLQLN